MEYKIWFAESTTEIYEQERRSCVLCNASPLYKYAKKLRAVLEKRYGDKLQPLRMDYHIALMSYAEMKSSEYKNLLDERHAQIADTIIKPTFGFIKKAFVLWTTAKSHITLGYFPGGHPTQEEIQELSEFKDQVFVEVEDPLGE